ncbi:MAG TPA: cytochrome P450 [Polyangiaceae bacterium]|nr:cytochrome P450 [Polyangiaceae bacterium]
MQAATLPFAKAPGPQGAPLFGSLFDAWRDPLKLLSDCARDHGDVVRLRFGPYHYVLVSGLSEIQHVLVKNQKNYVKSRSYQGVKLVLGDGLLTSEGEFWRRQRRLVQPAFHVQKLRRLAGTMARLTEDFVARWRSLPESGRMLDMHAEMTRLTFRIVGQTLCSSDVEGDAQAIGDAITAAMRFANEYVEHIVRIPTWLPTPKNFRFHRAKTTLDALVYRMIEEHRTRTDHEGDLLSMLMSETDEGDGEGMTPKQLRDEVMTLVLAGFETTTNALTWTLYLLSQHPEIARSLAQESSAVLGGRAATFEDLPRLELTERVLQEAMRLYPPAWCLERAAVEADEVGGYAIPAGTTIAICPYVLHRNPSYWDDPETFDPDRFLPERSTARSRFAYLPFGDGPRICIGKGFAMMEAKIVLAMIAGAFAFKHAATDAVALDPGITLRPKHGMRMTIAERTV